MGGGKPQTWNHGCCAPISTSADDLDDLEKPYLRLISGLGLGILTSVLGTDGALFRWFWGLVITRKHVFKERCS